MDRKLGLPRHGKVEIVDIHVGAQIVMLGRQMCLMQVSFKSTPGRPIIEGHTQMNVLILSR